MSIMLHSLAAISAWIESNPATDQIGCGCHFGFGLTESCLQFEMVVDGEPESGNAVAVATSFEVPQLSPTNYKRLCIAANIINRFHAAGLVEPPIHLVDLACSPTVSKGAWETAACNARRVLNQTLASSSEPMIIRPTSHRLEAGSMHFKFLVLTM